MTSHTVLLTLCSVTTTMTLLLFLNVIDLERRTPCAACPSITAELERVQKANANLADQLQACEDAAELRGKGVKLVNVSQHVVAGNDGRWTRYSVLVRLPDAVNLSGLVLF